MIQKNKSYNDIIINEISTLGSIYEIRRDNSLLPIKSLCTQQALTTFQTGNPNQTIEYQLNIVEILRTCSIHKWLNSSKLVFP